MPKRSKGSKFYAVAVGRTPGIYPTWEECHSNVNGYPNARFKKFSTEEEAQSFIASVSKTVRNNDNTVAAASETRTKKKRRTIDGAKNPEDPTSGNAANPIAVEGKFGDPDDRGNAVRKNSDDESAAKQYPHKLMFHVMFDGGSRGNPCGHAGAGTYVLKRSFYPSEQTAKKNPTEILRHTTRIRSYLGMGKLTNNQAEYMGLVVGLEQVYAALKKTDAPNGECDVLKDVTVLIQGDSDLIVKQMNGIYACKSANLKSYHQRAKNLVQKVRKTSETIGATLGITFQHVYRESNTIADGLANEAMDAQRSWTTSEGQDRKKVDTKPREKAVQMQRTTQSDDDATEV